ncbi:MAG: hypothetical protein E7505_04130 [Ruminococcus sp.]|nr:hypothetical protein [Ruminococcus sp.]
MQNISYKVALGGVISSLCLLCMFLTGIFPVLYITLPMIAGILMMIMSVEITPSWAFLTYAATGTLAVFVTFDKEAALLYIMLFGHYPIIKQYIDSLKPGLIRFIVKTAVFNVCILSEFMITVKLLGITEFYEQLVTKGKAFSIAILLIINAICFLYDYSLESMLLIYCNKIKPKLIRRR